MSRTMIRNLVLGLVLAASAGVQGLYAQRYPERRVLRAGNALYEQENYPEAEIRYRKAQEQSPTYEGLFNLADALYKQKRYDEALNILKQISRDEVAGPHAPDAYYNLGNTYFQQKKLPEAAEASKNALRRNPLDDEARISEIARMNAGAQITKIDLEHARAILHQAQTIRKKLRQRV